MFARGAAFKQYHLSILRYKLTTLLHCVGRSFLASPRKEPKKATWGRRSDCAVVTLLHFGTTPDSPNSPSPKTPSAQGISSTNQIKNLGSHLPRCAKLLHDTNRFLNSSINIYLTVVPAATPCVPLQRGRSLIGSAANRPINIYLTLFHIHRRSTRKGYNPSVALLRR